MGLVTDNALAFLKRFVFDIASALQFSGLMTLVAQSAAVERDGKRLLRGRVTVTLLTFDLVQKRMGAGFHQLRLHR